MRVSSCITPLLPANRVRVLAVTADKRLPQWPDVPAVAEAGVPGFEYTAWVGAFVPAGTPRAIIERLHGDSKKALDHPEVSSRYNNIALSPMFSTPEQFTARMKAEYDQAAKLIAATGVTVN